MATLSRAKSKHMYSWWWDSHISPKNSKWLQDNLTDMDSKVKTMIKLIEVDEDTFARRAEMYYKKRPELMKLVEEFYRAYRALAERYDHATGVIHQAHRTMEEHQVPFMMSDDGPTNGFDPPTPDESHKGAIGLPSANSFFGKENDGKGSKQFNGYGKARKGLNFHEVDEKVESLNKNENDVQALKDALAKVEAEKEAGLLQYKQTLVRLSELESYVSRAETESEVLKEELTRLKAEKETLLSKYMEALEKTANLDNKLLLAEDYADISEKEAEAMREIIAKLKAEVRDSAAKLKGSEEQCHLLHISNRSLQSEVESLVQKLGTLWTCLEEERMRFMEVDTSFQSLQNLHSNVQVELQQKVRLLKEMEIQNQNLEDEAKNANKALNDLNMSAAMSMKGLQEENFDLKEAKEKLSERNTFLENSLFDANAQFESELDKAVNAQFDSFVLQKCIHDMEDKNLYMMGFCEKLLEASRLSEELISELDRTNRRQEEEMSVLTSQTKELRTGMFRLLETLETTKSDSTFDVYNDDDDDQRVLHHIGVRLENIKTWLGEAWDENQKLVVENSVLVAVLCQLKNDDYDHSAISSLRDAVASLEKHTILNLPHKIENEDKEGSEHNQNGLIDLQEVQARIQAIEKAVIESNKHKKEERSTIRSDSDLKTRQIEVFKSQSGSHRGIGRSSRRFDSNYGSTDDNKTTKTSLSVSESANEFLMKDIMLDRTSDYSPYGKNKRNMGSHDPVLELWEPYRSSTEMVVEKELCVDGQQEISKRFSNPDQDEYKRKTLERLASDVQKLTNIQIMVRDLKEKLNTTEHKGKSVEYDGVEDQIAETEETISKLFGYTRKLMKKIENSSTASSFDGSVTVDSLDSGSVRRRCLEQARRVSEKIGRVQLEVQKVQFAVIKQDTLKTGRGGTRIMERGSRTVLRDYLYGSGSKPPPQRRKRTHFCGCVQPPAKG